MRKVCYSCSFVIFFVPESLFMIGIPSIVAENMPETPPMSSSDIASAWLESSPTPSDSRYRDLDNSRSMSVDLRSGVRLQMSGHSRRTSDYSTICPNHRKKRLIFSFINLSESFLSILL